MTMNGRIVHEWSHPFENIEPKTGWETDDPISTEYWRKVHLCANGDLLAIHEGMGMIRLDKNSRLLWAWPGRCHHDIHVGVGVLQARAGQYAHR